MLETRSEKFKEYIAIERSNQTIYQFPNGYGASVVVLNDWLNGSFVELAVIRDEQIVYDTPITDDVVRVYNDLDDLLQKVKDLERGQ